MLLECPHRPPCPGCPELGRTDHPADARDALAALAHRTGTVTPPLRRGADTGFRQRARLAIRGRARSPKVGIFAERTHQIVHIPRCLVHHPVINEVAHALERAIRATGTPPYSDQAKQGLARYVQIVVETATQQAQVVLIGRDPDPMTLMDLGEELRRLVDSRLHSLWLNAHPEDDNAILGKTFHHVFGPAAVEECVGGARVFYPPDAFGQSHTALAAKLAAWVQEQVPSGRHVLELYAGTGAIGLGLVGRSTRVTFNEIAPGGVAGLEMGIAALPEGFAHRTSVLPGPAEDALAAIGTADVVVVDPPRKGLDTAVTEALTAEPPESLLYVACGLDAFVRDAARLTEGGALRLVELAAFDLFAHTGHIEVVGRFGRT